MIYQRTSAHLKEKENVAGDENTTITLYRLTYTVSLNSQPLLKISASYSLTETEIIIPSLYKHHFYTGHCFVVCRLE